MKNFEGTVQGHRDGHGFILRDDGEADVFLPPAQMRAVMHGDRVRAAITGFDRKGRAEARVQAILARPPRPLVARLLKENGQWLARPDDPRYSQDVLIDKRSLGGAREGQIVVIALTGEPQLHVQPAGRVTEVLGEAGEAGLEIEIAVRKFGLPHTFSPQALAEAQALPDSVQPAERAGRIDLTDIPLVTIDGEDARDFDDAVYAQPAVVSGRGRRPNGWRLLVAIADVSHYVRNDSPIDIDAYDRATSVYFPRRVIPMLPEKLSNGLCSLNPQVDRLALVCDMLIDRQGQTVAYQFYPAVIHSHARLTYTQVADLLAGRSAGDSGVSAGQFALLPQLQHLQEVYRALLAARQARGAVELESVETQIVSDEQGRITQIQPRTRNEAHRIIEEAMLAANVSAADYLISGQREGLFRVHDAPPPDKLATLRSYLAALGLRAQVPDEPQPADIQRIATAAAQRPDATQIHATLLRSMSQALYSPANTGHFGLAYPAYTHFTSPIRRYPDLLVHRVIKAMLAGRKYTLPALPLPGEAHEKLKKRLEKTPRPQAAKTGKTSKTRLAWEAAGLHCSANERRADEASRDVQAWLKCQYMQQHLGEYFEGVVTAVTGFGLFVTLQELYVEGLVHISELRGDYYHYDEIRQELRGERQGLTWRLGQSLRVQVARVDLDARRIDFRLAAPEQENPPAPRTRRKTQQSAQQPGERSSETAPAPRAKREAKAKTGTKAGTRPGKTKASRKTQRR